MQHASKTTLPATGPGHRTAGVDWARDDHAVAIVDAGGQVVERFTVAHTAAGIRDLVRRLAKNGAHEVAIERPDGPVVEGLLEAGLTVVVISPNQLKNLRSRYGSAGNKDDRFDAFVLADTLRTDRARLRPLVPDSPATVALRAACRARKDLVAHRIALANQLRAHLQRTFPGAVGLFADIDSPISLRSSPASTARSAPTGSPPGAWPPGWPASATAAGSLQRPCRHGSRPRPGAPPAPRVPPRSTSPAPSWPPWAPWSSRSSSSPSRSTSSSPSTPTPTSSPAWPAPAPCAPPPAGRDRRLPRPLPDPRIAGLPGWRRAQHSPVRQVPCGRLPLGCRQAAPRRHLRLRRRLHPRQPLGCRPLPPRHRPWPRPPPCRPHPRPRLAVRDLALLAERNALRPGSAPRPSGAPPAGGLT